MPVPVSVCVHYILNGLLTASGAEPCVMTDEEAITEAAEAMLGNTKLEEVGRCIYG